MKDDLQKLYSDLKEWGCDIDCARSRFLEDDELYVRCLTRFAWDPAFERMQQALEGEPDYGRAYEAAHFLKGSALTLNLDPIARTAARVTGELDGQPPRHPGDLLVQWRGLQETFRGYMEEYLSASRPSGSRSGTARRDR